VFVCCGAHISAFCLRLSHLLLIWQYCDCLEKTFCRTSEFQNATQVNLTVQSIMATPAGAPPPIPPGEGSGQQPPPDKPVLPILQRCSRNPNHILDPAVDTNPRTGKLYSECNTCRTSVSNSNSTACQVADYYRRPRHRWLQSARAKMSLLGVVLRQSYLEVLFSRLRLQPLHPVTSSLLLRRQLQDTLPSLHQLLCIGLPAFVVYAEQVKQAHCSALSPLVDAVEIRHVPSQQRPARQYSISPV
jgi:hypothetical protein